MSKKLVTTILCLAIAGCATTSGPRFQLAPDVKENRAEHQRLISNLFLRYDHFQHYIFSRPNELIVREISFGKISGLFGPISKDKAQYCIYMRAYDPNNDTIFTETLRTFRARVEEQIDNPKNLRASVETIKNKPVEACAVANGTPWKELEGHVFRRVN